MLSSLFFFCFFRLRKRPFRVFKGAGVNLEPVLINKTWEYWKSCYLGAVVSSQRPSVFMSTDFLSYPVAPLWTWNPEPIISACDLHLQLCPESSSFTLDSRTYLKLRWCSSHHLLINRCFLSTWPRQSWLQPRVRSLSPFFCPDDWRINSQSIDERCRGLDVKRFLVLLVHLQSRINGSK